MCCCIMGWKHLSLGVSLVRLMFLPNVFIHASDRSL